MFINSLLQLTRVTYAFRVPFSYTRVLKWDTCLSLVGNAKCLLSKIRLVARAWNLSNASLRARKPWSTSSRQTSPANLRKFKKGPQDFAEVGTASARTPALWTTGRGGRGGPHPSRRAVECVGTVTKKFWFDNPGAGRMIPLTWLWCEVGIVPHAE